LKQTSLHRSSKWGGKWSAARYKESRCCKSERMAQESEDQWIPLPYGSLHGGFGWVDPSISPILKGKHLSSHSCGGYWDFQRGAERHGKRWWPKAERSEGRVSVWELQTWRAFWHKDWKVPERRSFMILWPALKKGIKQTKSFCPCVAWTLSTGRKIWPSMATRRKENMIVCWFFVQKNLKTFWICRLVPNNLIIAIWWQLLIYCKPKYVYLLFWTKVKYYFTSLKKCPQFIKKCP